MFDPRLLETFLAIVEEGSFAGAARRRNAVPSTISQHIQRLEQQSGRRLFDRDTHSVVLTVDGQAFVDLARRIVEANDRARAYFAGAELRGRVRLGVSEDFALSQLLPLALRHFSHGHPRVDIELTVGLSAELYARIDDGGLDLIFAKRRGGDDRGTIVWRDPLIWIGAPDWLDDPSAPLPLILYPAPSVTRTFVLNTLEESGRRWRIACTCTSLGGLRSAVAAGLGISAQSEKLIPERLERVGARAALPILPTVDFVLLPAQRKPVRVVETLMKSIHQIAVSAPTSNHV
ncbi:MAG: LysR family transcriptional regulator [Phyllobacteriaceae bacterium]|nr:LysR family transcriptional regulator [Phyllobacteriaceae bacterium]